MIFADINQTRKHTEIDWLLMKALTEKPLLYFTLNMPQPKKGKGKGKKKGKQKGKGGGGKTKKQNNKQNKKQNKQNQKKHKNQDQGTKLRGIFGLNSVAPSAETKTDLLISGFIRNCIGDKRNDDINKTCLKYARNVFSILSHKQCELLIQRLIKKEIIKGNKQKFVCLMNAKCDGFDGKIFHKRCNYKGATLTVIKSEYDYIFGGFTNVQWIKPNQKKGAVEYSEDYKAFLFSFYLSTDNLEIYDIDFNSAAFAIENTLEKGPIFGYSDIIIGGENCDKERISFCKTSHYKINGDGNKLCGGNDDSVSDKYYRYKVDNYEVFQLK